MKSHSILHSIIVLTKVDEIRIPSYVVVLKSRVEPNIYWVTDTGPVIKFTHRVHYLRLVDKVII